MSLRNILNRAENTQTGHQPPDIPSGRVLNLDNHPETRWAGVLRDCKRQYAEAIKRLQAEVAALEAQRDADIREIEQATHEAIVKVQAEREADIDRIKAQRDHARQQLAALFSDIGEIHWSKGHE